MCENFENHLKNIVKNSNDYKKIYAELKKIFSVDMVGIWKYNSNAKNFSLLSSDKSVEMAVESGLTRQVLVRKKSIFSNHIISEKSYVPEVDNINAYKIKSMVVAPILENNSIIGFIRLYRDLKSKRNFSSKDIAGVEMLMPILSKIVLNRELVVDDVLSLSVDKKRTSKIKPTVTETVAVQKKKKESVTEKKVDNEKKQLQAEKKELEREKRQFQLKIKELESIKQKLALEKKELQNSSIKLQSNVKKLEEEIEKYRVDKKSIEESLALLNDKFNAEVIKNKELQTTIVQLEHEKNRVLTKFDGLKRSYEFLEKVSSSEEKKSQFDLLMDKIYRAQGENEHLMTLLEFALFVDDFSKLPKSVEESIKNSKVVSHILDVSPFIYSEKQDEKLEVRSFFKEIQSACEPFVKEKKIELKVSVALGTPKLLIFHKTAVESIIVRSIIKVQKFLQNDDVINMKVSFQDKQLSIVLSFNREKKKNVIKFFQAEKDILNDANDVFTKFNNKLLKTINGSIQTTEKEGHYSFVLKVSAVIIKL